MNEERAKTVLEESENGIAEEEEKKNVDDLKVAYIVGVTKDDKLVFDILGEDRGITQLLGLHAYAGTRIKLLLDESQLTGDRLTHEVGKAVALLAQKMDLVLQQMGGGGPGTPGSNKI